MAVGRAGRRFMGGLAALPGSGAGSVGLVMADGAAAAPSGAAPGHVPSDAADDGALDAPLPHGLERRDCSRDDERRENCRMNFHVASVSLFNANRRSAFPVAASVFYSVASLFDMTRTSTDIPTRCC